VCAYHKWTCCMARVQAAASLVDLGSCGKLHQSKNTAMCEVEVRFHLAKAVKSGAKICS